jgi:23S rRNA (adenine2030-N6)-methyltransferase
VPTHASRYRPDAPPDYSHRFHAGNVGDVWKHCALVMLLARAARDGRRVAFVDTHAGEGRYRLGPTGEWTEGIGRLWTDGAADADPSVAAYRALVRRLADGGERPHAYPGSPIFARAVLGAGAPLHLWERDAAACERLRAHCAGDVAARITCGDGLADLAAAIAATESASDTTIVLIDPPWAQKTDWTLVPDSLAQAASQSPRASFVLWYPVKSLTRPNAMMARLEKSGVSASLVELLTTPLAHQRQRLNGSGLVLVRPPDGVLAALGAAGTAIGERCATRPGAWSMRLVSW